MKHYLSFVNTNQTFYCFQHIRYSLIGFYFKTESNSCQLGYTNCLVCIKS